MPEPDIAETAPAVSEAIPGLWASGIVAIHNANDSEDGLALRTYQTLHRDGALGVRVLCHLSVANLAHARAMGLQSGLGDAWLRVGGIKMFADGALGSRTASMLRPFVGESRNMYGPVPMEVALFADGGVAWNTLSATQTGARSAGGVR